MNKNLFQNNFNNNSTYVFTLDLKIKLAKYKNYYILSRLRTNYEIKTKNNNESGLLA